MKDKAPAPHYYGGQALLEGVMMRGRDRWAVAVRRPTRDIWVEQHPVRSLATKYPLFRKPLFRGVGAMGEALSIGMRAMMISANQSMEEEAKLSSKQMGGTIVFALLLFFVIFILFPNLLSNLFGHRKNPTASHSILQNVYEGLIRLAIFIGYLLLISLAKEIRRVFQYHGAEHKTIAAYEANEPVLTPEVVDKYSTLHVRCGTNFLIMTMLLTIVVFTFFGRPAIWLQVLERLGGIFLIAGISYEGLRLGAAKTDNPFVRALMKPGLWLQKITTREPGHDQIEVAIRSFEAVLPQAERARVAPLPSPVVAGDSLHEEDEPTAEP
ncbi:MAG: DUF1385 domain-containing protein [Actinomycetota bacterium]